MTVRIGTRGSKLALWQAHKVKEILEGVGLSVEMTLYKTTGDIRTDKALHNLGERGLFTKALDEALLSGNIDIAVHSSKDVPSQVPEGLELIAFMKREDPRDVLVATDESVDLDNLNSPIVIGTSSLRRQSLLKHYAPHCEVKLIRGNVDTRVSKLEGGGYDALILAYAGVKRMGYLNLVRRKLNVNTFTPAVGQGAIGIMGRVGGAGLNQVREALNHKETELAILAERAFLRKLEGGCHTPIFALATVMGDSLSLQGGLGSIDGSVVMRESIDGHSSQAKALGNRLAESLLLKGATEILNG